MRKNIELIIKGFFLIIDLIIIFIVLKIMFKNAAFINSKAFLCLYISLFLLLNYIFFFKFFINKNNFLKCVLLKYMFSFIPILLAYLIWFFIEFNPKQPANIGFWFIAFLTSLMWGIFYSITSSVFSLITGTVYFLLSKKV